MNVTIEFYPKTYPKAKITPLPKTTYHMAVMQTCIVGQNNITFFPELDHDLTELSLDLTLT